MKLMKSARWVGSGPAGSPPAPSSNTRAKSSSLVTAFGSSDRPVSGSIPASTIFCRLKMVRASSKLTPCSAMICSITSTAGSTSRVSPRSMLSCKSKFSLASPRSVASCSEMPSPGALPPAGAGAAAAAAAAAVVSSADIADAAVTKLNASLEVGLNERRRAGRQAT